MEDVSELVERYMEQEQMYRMEGRAGLENLCQLTGALGYKDPQYYGQMSSKAVLGDLVMFLEDNSGAVEAVVEWIKQQRSPEWHAALSEVAGHADVDEDDSDTDTDNE